MYKRRTIMAIAILASLCLLGTEARAAVLKVPSSHSTIQNAVEAASPGDTIIVRPGEYYGATVNKRVKILGIKAVINDGPHYGGPASVKFKAGFLLLEGSSGTQICGFTFDCPEVTSTADEELVFPVFSRGVNNVTVKHNVIQNAVQGITNWHGSGWVIKSNKIRGGQAVSGGGIGIFIGSNDRTGANHNLIASNSIIGEPEAEDYSTPAIALMSDARYDRSGGPVKGNRVHNNRCAFRSPSGIGVELTDLVGGDVVNNSVSGNRLTACSFGAALFGANSNCLMFNSLDNNSDAGVYISSEEENLGGDQNRINFNRIKNSEIGVWVEDEGCAENKIIFNCFWGNTTVDIKNLGTDTVIIGRGSVDEIDPPVESSRTQPYQ